MKDLFHSLGRYYTFVPKSIITTGATIPNYNSGTLTYFQNDANRVKCRHVYFD